MLAWNLRSQLYLIKFDNIINTDHYSFVKQGLVVSHYWKVSHSLTKRTQNLPTQDYAAGRDGSELVTVVAKPRTAVHRLHKRSAYA